MTECQCAVCTMRRLREEAKFRQMREDMPKIVEAIKAELSRQTNG